MVMLIRVDDLDMDLRDNQFIYGWDQPPGKGPTPQELEERRRKNRERTQRQRDRAKLNKRKGGANGS